MPVNLDDYDPDAPVKQQAVGNALGALDVEPEAYSRNAALAKRLALPAPVVEMDPTGFARQDKTQETLKWLEDTPPLARYVAKNPNAAKVSSDDYRNLSEISRTLGGLPGMERQGSEETPAPVVPGEVPDWQKKFMTGFQRGTLSEQRGKIGRKMIAVGDTPEDWRAVTTLDKQLQGLTDDASWAQWTGQLFAGLSSGGNDALLGFGAGAAVGALAGPVGAGAGAMTGAMWGWLGSQAATAAGNSYLNLKQAGVDPVPARLGSIAVGTINYLANRVMMDSASRGVVDTLVQSGLKEVLKNPVVSAAVTKGLVELGKAGVTGASLFAAQEAATAIVEDLTKTYQGNLPTLFNDPAAHAAALDRVKHAALDGLAMMTVMHVPKVGVNMVADSIYMKQANLYHQMVKEAIDQSVLSETYRRDPDLFRQFITENSEQQIGIHSDIINQLGADKFEWIPDLAPQLEKAKATGADVTVSLPTLLAHGSEFMKENPEVLDHVRVGEGLTKAEADWLKANPPNYFDLYHGSPYLFDRFNNQFFATGEGANTYGQGHYVTEHPGIAEFYKNSVHGIVQRRTTDILLDGQSLESSDNRIEQRIGTRLAEEMQYGTAQDLPTIIEHAKSYMSPEEIAHLDSIKDRLTFNRPDLYPTIYKLRLKAKEDELTNLRETLENQNDRTKAAVAQIFKEMEKHSDFDTVSEEFSFGAEYARGEKLRELVGAADDLLGPDRVREIFVEHGIKAHRYETSRSMDQGGEIVSKDGNFVRDEELTQEHKKRDLYAGDVANYTAFLATAEERAKDTRITQAEREKAAKEAEIFRQELANAKKLLNALGGPNERKPAYNFVVLDGDSIEITHRNDEPLVKPVPEEIAASPEASAKFSESMDLAKQSIDAEVKANWLYGLFEGQKALGMTGKEYLTYLRLLDKKNKALYDKAFAKAEAEAKKILSPEYKARFEEIRSEVAAEMNRDPVHLADRLIRLGKMDDGEKVEAGFPYKLSRDDVENMFRHFQPDSALNEFAQQLGVKAPVPDDLPGSMYGKNSMHPDDIAALTGFDSGRDMVLALVNLEARRRESGLDPARYFDSQVKAEATRRIEAERGTLEERIQEWAADAVKSRPQMEVLANEMKVLAREAGHQGPITLDMIRSQLDKITEETPIGQTRKAALWERRAGEYGKQAELGMNAGDPQTAFLAKQSQFVNFLMAKQAKELDRAFEQLQGTFKRLRDNLTLSGVDQKYVDQLHLVMATVFDERLYRDPAELMRSLNGVTFETFVNDLRADGKQINPPEFLTSHDPTTGGVKADLLPTGDFLALKDFFDQMLFYGRQEHKLTVKDNQIEFNDAVGQAVLQTSELKQRGFEPAGKLTSIFRTADAALLRMERLFDWLDQRSPDGIFNRVVFRPLADAQGRKQTMLAEIAKDVGALPKFRGSDAVSGGSQFRDSRGRPIVWDKGKVIAAALNMGNESNWQKLTRGYSWDADTFRAFVMDNMTKENWQFVQGVWDSFEKLFPQADEVSRRTNGVGLKKIEAAPVQTQYGEFRGGYYPLIEDEGNLLRKDKKDLRFDGPGFAPMLTRGYEKWRTNAIYPLSLDINMLTAKFNEEVHNIAFREAWMNAKKFLDDSKVRTSIEDAFGKEYLGMVDPWMEYIRASGGGPDRSGLAGIKDWLRFGRENMVTAMIGLKPGTAVIHGLGALSNSVREVGGLDFYRATVDSIFKSPQGYDSVRQAILDKSEMMANRKHNMDRDAAAAINAININNRFGQWRASYAQFATGLVSALDMASAVPTWWAAYNKHLAEHGDEAGAIYAADKATRNAHGGNGLIDLPALLRGTNTTQGEVMKFTTAFGGYFNHVYNQMRDVHVAATDPTMKAGFGKFMYVAGGLLGYLVVPAILHEAVRPPKEGFDEEHLPKEMAWALANQSMAMVPFVRDIGAMFQLGKNKVEAGGPLGELLSGLTAPAGDFRRMLNDKEPRHVAQHMLELPTWATGLGPPRYVASQLEYLYKLNDGSTRLPETYLEWHRLLLDARPVGK